MKVPPVVASDPVELHADWIELQALQSSTKQVSLESFIRVIRRGGSTEAVSGSRGDVGSETSQRIGQDAFAEIERRARDCGEKGYPFEIEPGLVRSRRSWPASAYGLLLFLSGTEPTTGHNGTAVLFERLCREAALHFLGGPRNNAVAFRFGSPRKKPFAKLSQAIDELCKQVVEGGGCKSPEKAEHNGDDGLDIVAWRKFPDFREGKLIAFGQCAGGEGNWESKLSELDGRKFAQKWFRQIFVVDPIRLFFLPRCVPREDWENAGIDGGILFDRCRIVACLPALHKNLARDCRKALAALRRRKK